MTALQVEVLQVRNGETTASVSLIQPFARASVHRRTRIVRLCLAPSVSQGSSIVRLYRLHVPLARASRGPRGLDDQRRERVRDTDSNVEKSAPLECASAWCSHENREGECVHAGAVLSLSL